MTMFRKVKNKENPYVIINKRAMADDTLSWKAKGILAYLLSLPDDWKIYETELATHSSDGITCLKTGLKELIDRGYIVRQRIKDENGKFAGYEYNIYEEPLQNIEENTAIQDYELGVSENIISPTELGVSENRFSINGKTNTTNNNNKLNNNNINIVELSSNSNSVNPILQTNKIITNNNSYTVHKQIVDYLNSKANKKYKYNTSSTVKHINARLKSGYTVQDFFKVIDIKVQEWKNTTMDKYLRPDTLFGNKFENYVNQVPCGNYNRGIDMNEYNKLHNANTKQQKNDIDDILNRFNNK